MTHPYTPGGRTHTMLRRMAQGPCKAGHLFAALGYPFRDVPHGPRRKFWRLVDHLAQEGLITKDPDGTMEITYRGVNLLEGLEAEAPTSSGPNVRIFVERAA